jgi:hypothetical protein
MKNMFGNKRQRERLIRKAVKESNKDMMKLFERAKIK